jgi:shikimate kinase
MRLLTPYGSFLYLKLEEEVLAKRILNGELPPFLRGSEPPERMLRDLLRYRTPLFEQWADFTVDLEDASREENSGRIYRLLKDRRYVG